MTDSGDGRDSGTGTSPSRQDSPAVDLPERVAVDWDALRTLATQAAAAAYCPYSHLQVGAAALVDDGRVITGCNVENASYGLGLCAECTLVGQLRLTGGGRLVALACRSGAGELLMPCGRCRQVIYEFGGPELMVDTPTGPEAMMWVLPAAFGPSDLPVVPNRTGAP